VRSVIIAAGNPAAFPEEKPLRSEGGSCGSRLYPFFINPFCGSTVYQIWQPMISDPAQSAAPTGIAAGYAPAPNRNYYNRFFPACPQVCKPNASNAFYATCSTPVSPAMCYNVREALIKPTCADWRVDFLSDEA
jgi:hypothetical protein